MTHLDRLFVLLGVALRVLFAVFGAGRIALLLPGLLLGELLVLLLLPVDTAGRKNRPTSASSSASRSTEKKRPLQPLAQEDVVVVFDLFEVHEVDSLLFGREGHRQRSLEHASLVLVPVVREAHLKRRQHTPG